MGDGAFAEAAVQQPIAHGPGAAHAGAAPHGIGGGPGLTATGHPAALLPVDAGEAIEPLLAPDRRPAAAGNVALEQGFGQLGEEHRGHRRLPHAAPQPPLAGMGKEQPLLGAGDAHIAEAPLLLQGGRIIEGAVAGEQPLLQPHQEHHGKLQALAGVKRHQGHPVRGGVLAVGVAGQGGAGEEALEIALLVFLLILQGGVHQFLKVAAPLLGLIAGLMQQLGHVAALLHHPLHQLGGGRLLAAALQILDQLAELQQPLG